MKNVILAETQSNRLRLTLPWEAIADSSKGQIEELLRNPRLETLVVLPDVHWGMNVCIGTLVLMRDVIVPSFVGVDNGRVFSISGLLYTALVSEYAIFRRKFFPKLGGVAHIRKKRRLTKYPIRALMGGLAQTLFRAYAGRMTKLLVLGIGNMLLTDDGVGVFAAQTLQQEAWPENVRVLDAGTFTHDIFYLFEGYDVVLVLDIVHCGGKPGAIYRLTGDELVQNEKQRLSLHDIDLLDSLNMAEMLYKKRPHLLVLGMEPEDFTSWNIGLSQTVQERFEAFLTTARKEIRALAGMENEAAAG